MVLGLMAPGARVVLELTRRARLSVARTCAVQ
jgi:hypothetical protein